jgi:hypothetical protein
MSYRQAFHPRFQVRPHLLIPVCDTDRPQTLAFYVCPCPNTAIHVCGQRAVVPMILPRFLIHERSDSRPVPFQSYPMGVETEVDIKLYQPTTDSLLPSPSYGVALPQDCTRIMGAPNHTRSNKPRLAV